MRDPYDNDFRARLADLKREIERTEKALELGLIREWGTPPSVGGAPLAPGEMLLGDWVVKRRFSDWRTSDA